MAQLTIRTFGPPELALDGAPVEIGRHKAVALLVYLAVTGERHRREALAALFWPDYEQSKGFAYLRRTLWEIKEALGEGWLDAGRATVGLARGAACWLDLAAFREAIASAGGHGHAAAEVCPACIEPLSRAAELYRGDFLAGFSLRDSFGFDDWQLFLSEGLRQEAGEVLRRLSAIHERERRLDPAIDHARRWLALDPLNEGAHRQLMLLYALNGQRSAALRQYQECRRLLEAEMGIAPERRTGELARRIEGGGIAAAAVDAAPVVVSAGPDGTAPPAAARASPAPRHTLPQLLTPFIGRERELAELEQLLSDPEVRLVTILAVGGMGKTRLAIEAATRAAGRYPHGAHFAYLAPLQASLAIFPVLADVLDLPPQEGLPPQHQVLDYLAEKRLLLVLDNFEHLVEGAAGVGEILRAAPGVQVLATSRLPLELQGEHRYHLVGMDYPAGEPVGEAAEYGAVRLFVQGARQALPGFRLATEEQRHVAAICRLVDGMPLAVLLAAGWTELLSPAQIAARVAQGLDIFETGLQDVPERQRNLRVVLAQAWDLLGDAERRSAMGLSVFGGSFDRQAAQAVSGAGLRVLMALVRKSLLMRLPDDRLVVHELLRQYAAERLSEDGGAFEEAHDRHSALYCGRLEEWAHALKEPRLARGRPDVELDTENVRLAWSWAAIGRRVDRLAAAAEGLGLLLFWQGPGEAGEGLFALAVDALEDPEDDAARVLLAYLLAWQAAFTSGLTGQHPGQAHTLLDRSLTLLDGVRTASRDRVRAQALAHFVRGSAALSALDWQAAEEALHRSLPLLEQAGERWWMALVLERLGNAAWVPNDLERTRAFFERSLAFRQELGDRVGAAGLLIGLGGLFGFDLGRVDEAAGFFGESSRLFAEMGGRVGRYSSLAGREAIARLHGRFAEAGEIVEQQMALILELGDRGRIAELGMLRAELHTLMGRYRLGEAEHRRNAAIVERSGWKGPETWGRWALAAALLGAGDFEEAMHVLEPNLLILEQSGSTSMLGRCVAALGRAELGLGRPEAAWAHALQGIALLADRHYFWLLEAMATAAALLAERGEVEAAVEIDALLRRHPYVANSPWFADLFGRAVERAAAGLAQDVVEAARARGRELDLWQAARELLAAHGLEAAADAA